MPLSLGIVAVFSLSCSNQCARGWEGGLLGSEGVDPGITLSRLAFSEGGPVSLCSSCKSPSNVSIGTGWCSCRPLWGSLLTKAESIESKYF